MYLNSYRTHAHHFNNSNESNNDNSNDYEVEKWKFAGIV